MGKKRMTISRSIFSSLPSELRTTIASNIASSAVVPPPSAAVAFPSPLTSSSTTASPTSTQPSPSISQKRPAPADGPDSEGRVAVVKRRKPWSEVEAGSRTHPWDCQALVTRHTKMNKVPQELKKYYAQRTRLFSMYDELPMLLDTEGWYSVTPERIAIQIAERLRCGTVLDAFCGVGGNAIAFAQTCERVIALDTSPLRLSLARHNALQYGVADRIEFILCDFVSFAKSLSSSSSSSSRPLNGIDVVFLSPPWGGISYLTQFASSNPSSANTELLPPAYPLSALQPLHGKELFDLARRISKDVAYYLPKNSGLDEVAALAEKGERIEVEEEWMSGKLKALTVLFGDLAGTGDSGNV